LEQAGVESLAPAEDGKGSGVPIQVPQAGPLKLRPRPYPHPRPGQGAAAIEGPHDAIGPTRSGKARPRSGSRAGFQGVRGEGVRATDDGESTCRRRNSVFVDARDPASRLVRYVDGVQLARLRLGEVCRLALSQAAHHLRPRRQGG
jgi:hypothetical protein